MKGVGIAAIFWISLKLQSKYLWDPSPEKVEQRWQDSRNGTMPSFTCKLVCRIRLLQPICGDCQHDLGASQWQLLRGRVSIQTARLESEGEYTWNFLVISSWICFPWPSRGTSVQSSSFCACFACIYGPTLCNPSRVQKPSKDKLKRWYSSFCQACRTGSTKDTNRDSRRNGSTLLARCLNQSQLWHQTGQLVQGVLHYNHKDWSKLHLQLVVHLVRHGVG